MVAGGDYVQTRIKKQTYNQVNRNGAFFLFVIKVFFYCLCLKIIDLSKNGFSCGNILVIY